MTQGFEPGVQFMLPSNHGAQIVNQPSSSSPYRLDSADHSKTCVCSTVFVFSRGFQTRLWISITYLFPNKYKYP